VRKTRGCVYEESLMKYGQLKVRALGSAQGANCMKRRARFLSFTLASLISLPVFAADADFEMLLNQLKQKDNVNVHMTGQGGFLISWVTPDPRRVDNKTISVVNQLASFSQKNPEVEIDISVFQDAQSTRLSSQSVTNTEFKAKRIETVLRQKASMKSQITAIGMGSEIPYNLIFASIHKHVDDSVPVMVAVPVYAR